MFKEKVKILNRVKPQVNMIHILKGKHIRINKHKVFLKNEDKFFKYNSFCKI